MDKVILGLLACRDLTIYEIKKAAEQSISFFFSASYGTLHPAVRRLAAKGFVTERRDGTGDRVRKVYSITATGKKALGAWLEEDIQAGRVQEEGLLKIFFFSNIPKRKQLKILRNYSCLIGQRLGDLKALESAARERQIPAHFKKANNYQMLTAEFGIAYLQFEKRWYDDLIKKLENGDI